MTLSSTLRIGFAWLAIICVTACKDIPADATQPAAAATPTAAADPAVPEAQPDLAPGTVLKLNPIVARSKAALDRFDEISSDLDAARKAGDKARIAAIVDELARLKSETEAARTQFQAEKQALIARKEYYNPVVLGAMEQFVAEAPDEIADALAQQNR